jgi:hypothetical protein
MDAAKSGLDMQKGYPQVFEIVEAKPGQKWVMEQSLENIDGRYATLR